MQGMDADMMAACPAAAMQGMDADMMAAMPADTMDAMNADQMGMVPPDAIPGSIEPDDGGMGALDAALDPMAANPPPGKVIKWLI